ncbi:NAD(P)-dependent oxidoreductase [Castellaniella denitrificans]|uniref:NAD(P)-dependent oxidoreductase n=1 Tax=Castellaniella denitrificans TaxID=56119 RepID=A0ABT4M4F1_9BURK|nr:NAD(P)-dependent oxidoreductase [Castellaniella denitrificans]MCZ4330204.1 NAD(P)-dependent oxidoreductase [Castellaniella denitrificans]
MKDQRRSCEASAPQATILGGHGFIGQALHSRLTHLGWSVWVPERQHLWPEAERALGHVFYCAGLTADYLQRPADTAHAHICLLNQVLQSARYTSLVYLSSTRVYDALAGHVRQATEEMSLPVQPSNPRHLYDLSKLAGEALCHALGAGRARVARLSCVYQETKEATGFLPDLLRLVSSSTTRIELDSSPYYVRDYIHLDDVLRALIDIAVQGRQATYNVASGANVSNAELAAYIHQVSGKQLHFLQHAQGEPGPVADITRLADEFGWRPEPVQARIYRYLLGLTHAENGSY